MKFTSDSQEIQYYMMEYFRKHNNEEVSISDCMDYVKHVSKKDFSAGKFSGVTNRLSSSSKTGISKCENKRGYYIYSKELDKTLQKEDDTFNDSKKIIEDALAKLEKELLEIKVMDCDLKKASKVKDVMISMNKALEIL